MHWFQNTSQLIEGIRSLERRSLIEKSPFGFTQQPVVMEYMTQKFIEEIAQEIQTEEVHRLHSHPIMQATAKDYVKASQIRMIVTPLLRKLRRQYGDPKNKLQQLLSKLQQHPQQDIVASGSEDKSVKLWDIKTGECLQTFFGHRSGVLGIQFSPQGNLLASSSRDRTIKLWDVSTGECVQTLSGHQDQIRSVDFTFDGLQVISGSLDWTIKVWDVKTGDCLKTLQPIRPYEGMNITQIQGLTESLISTLKTLGAVETVITVNS